MLIYLIRHTPVTAPERTCYGSTDIALDEGWRTHLEALKGKLPLEGVTDSNVYSSPLTRCVTLARELHPGATTDGRLREMDYGAWEMKPWDQLPRADVERWLGDLENTSPPGGETLGEVSRRANAAIETIARDAHETAFVLSHGATLRCVVAHLLGAPIGNLARIQIDYGSVTRIRFEGERVKVDYVNR